MVYLIMMRQISGSEPRMWGTSIVGFGDRHYHYASGRQGDWFLVGFSPRKDNLTLYLSFGGLQDVDLVHHHLQDGEHAPERVQRPRGVAALGLVEVVVGVPRAVVHPIADRDQEIADLLRRQDVIIARRTVAKYRDILGILPSSKRKKYFDSPKKS